ncbi:MAG: flagellar export chaperone FliS [Candidatus Zixiibacteriota bacterium]
MNNGYNTYKENSTLAMSQLDLILTVYKGTIDYIKKARGHFESERFIEGRTACERARKCIVHLYTTLDMEKGGEIAEKLGQLYAFMIEQLDLAVASKSLDLLDTIRGLLETIKEGWDGLKEQDKQTAAGTAAGKSNGVRIASQDGKNNQTKPLKQGLTLSA